MAFFSINKVSLKGISACVPSTIIKSEDIEILANDDNVEKFISSTGIKERRFVKSGQCTSDLCFKSANELLDKLGWERESVDILIFASLTPDYRSPATSCILQDRLGLSKSCFTLDISAPCSAFLQSLSIVGSMLQSGVQKRALLLIGDTHSMTSSPKDQSRYPIFGDAGSVTAWEFDEKAEPIYLNLLSDGSKYKSVYHPHSGYRNPVSRESFKEVLCEDGSMRAPIHGVMDGLEVFSFAITQCPRAVKAMCEHFDIDLHNDIDYYIFHQANLKLNMTVAKKLKLDKQKIPTNLDRFGNTCSASIPLTMVTEINQELSQKPLTLLFSAIGSGFVWGAAYIKTHNVVTTELLEL